MKEAAEARHKPGCLRKGSTTGPFVVEPPEQKRVLPYATDEYMLLEQPLTAEPAMFEDSLRPDVVGAAGRSHCGVLSLTVKGRLWLADPPLGDHNPPPGWDENETMGVFLKTGPGRAVFKGDGGQRASFQLASRGAEDPNAGCE